MSSALAIETNQRLIRQTKQQICLDLLRPALQCLLADICESKVDVVVVFKIDRLTRSLLDFAKIVEVFDALTSPSSR